MKLIPEEENLLASVEKTSTLQRLWITGLLAVFLWGVYAYSVQLRYGLGVTGLRDYASWGIYITNFVFFIGISHVGALMSAILRMLGADWRRPITRMAEAITFSSLFFGGLMPIIDMGRPDRLLNIFIHGRLQSPVLWDILCIGTYLVGSTIFLWLPMIPDIAILRERAAGWRHRLYTVLAAGWRGTERQHGRLERAIGTMTIIILPIAISVHTVVSWIFAMTLRPGWNSTIFGPYFVVGAIFSGAAAVIIAMAVFRRVYRLEAYIKEFHFQKMAIILMVFAAAYFYFNVNEYLTIGYKMAGAEGELAERLFFGDWARLFWPVQIVGVLVPLVLLAIPKTRTVRGIVFASVLVVVGAWLKRYVIIVPTMMNPFLGIQGVPWEWAHYSPTWVEWSITAGAFAGFMLLFTVVSKLFPIVSVWETRQAHRGEVPQ